MLLEFVAKKSKINRGKFAYLLVLSLVVNLMTIVSMPVVLAENLEILVNYNFDDSNAHDSSGHDNDGVIKGEVSYCDHDGGKAVVLNGNGWIELPTSLVYNNQQFTVEISFNTTSTQVGIFGYQNTSVNGSPDAYVPIISIDKEGKLYTEMYTTTQMVVSSSTTVNDGQWHRVILTSDNSSIKVYLDGQTLGSQSGSVNHYNMTYNQIGTNGAWSRPTYFNLSTYQWTPYTGKLDDFVFYPIAKTDTEIAKTTQTIIFEEISDKTTGDSTFNLNATASSGLPVTYSSSNTSVATVSGNTITIKGAGTTSITANQAGNDSYSAAAPVTRTLTVSAPTAAEIANEAIATARGLLPESFTASEGTDTNLITYLNGIAGMSDTGVTLTLDSSNGNVANDGTITYGSSGVTNDVVVHINKADGTEATKTISVTVPAHTMTDAEAVAGAKTDLDSSDLIFGGSDTATTVTQNLTLPLSGSNGTSISWTEKTDTGNNISLSGNSAVVTRPTYGEGDKTVTLTATITKNGATETKDIEVTVKEAAQSAAEIANEAIATARGLLPESFTASEGTDTNLITYLNGIAGMSDTGVTLTLDSSNGNVANDGTITYGSSGVTNDVVVHINKADGTEATKTISVTVPAHTMTDAEAVAGAKTDLDSSDLIFGGSDTATRVTQNLTLPLSGSNGTSISWTEKTDTGNNISLSGNSAVVTRPTYGEGDKTVTLTATITKNGATVTKDIEVTVKEAAPTKVDESSNKGNQSGVQEPVQEQESDEMGIIVVVNGEEQMAGEEEVDDENGLLSVALDINEELVEKKIEEVKHDGGNTVSVLVGQTDAAKIKTKLTGDLVEIMEEEEFTMIIDTGDVDYVIPADEIKINDVARKLGVADEELQSIEINIEINCIDDINMSESIEESLKKESTIVFPPVEFKIVAEVKEGVNTRTYDIERFNGYVERIIQITEEVDPSKITTGIVCNLDGSISHVPTVVFEENGKWYAKINSLTNSVYSVIWNDEVIENVIGHWSEESVNDMASRLVVDADSEFLPDMIITRQAFIKYVVKALGLYRGVSDDRAPFSDVDALNPYAEYIAVAYQYDLIIGYENGTFEGNELIIRDEAMAILARAMTVTGLVPKDMGKLSQFVDYDLVSMWAVDYVKEVVNVDIFIGHNNMLMSDKPLTYAEAIQAVRNLLIQSNLIDH